MNLVRKMFKNTRLTILLAAGLLVLLTVGGLLWQDQHKSEDFGTMIQKIAVAILNEDPESQLYYGAEEVNGLGWDPTKLSDYSDAYYQQINDDTEELLKKLDAYDAAKLSSEDKLTYDIVKWQLSAAQQLNKYSDLNTNGYLNLTRFSPYFANNYPIRNQADAENYIVALNGFSDKVAHFIDRIQDKQEEGFIPTSEFLKEILISLPNTKPEKTVLYTSYVEKLSEIKLKPSKEQELKQALLQTLSDHVVPSYGKLADVIQNDLLKQASMGQGVWSQPGGGEYYSALLRLYTGTDFSPLEIHEIAKRKAEEIVKELRSPVPGKAQETTAVNQRVAGDELLQTVNRSLSEIKPQLSDWFEEALIPNNPVDVRLNPAPFSYAGAFYIPPSINGDRNGRFFFPPYRSIFEEKAKMTAVHEGIPGHHFQYSIQYNQPEIPLARKITNVPGFTEGWATYAQSLGVEMGLLDQKTVQTHLLNVYVGTVIDTGINGLKWTREQAYEYMVRMIGPEMYLIDKAFASPGQITSYAIGYDQFQSLREKAESELKDRFDIKTFHSVLLRNGNMPFPILEQQVNQYIKSAK
ncbi:DUF885 domain-containing protein [Paenibacillus glacialis]|uniref:DUF885 domain-containing protein n=1 Tax=Paenibacillus glacialis TaxID=494026 RepID=A0A168KUU5_9BACL|nr:DUF885 domain-containing protein [Paenibacillus glacialis]OAB42492.1 hypothetical protein PGLA_12570 [Paenibacillus glacialis]